MSSNIILFLIGRAITGIGCGMAMGPPRIFSSEISLPNMRGVIGAFPAMAMSIGITTQVLTPSYRITKYSNSVRCPVWPGHDAKLGHRNHS